MYDYRYIKYGKMKIYVPAILIDNTGKIENMEDIFWEATLF